MSEKLVSFVLQSVDYTDYYRKEYPEWDGNHNTNVKCPFAAKHSTGEDKKPSFSININGKGGAFCHACATKIGSIIHHEKWRYKWEDDELAASRVYSKMIRPVLAAPGEVEDTLKSFEISLRGAPKVFSSILNEIQITKETVERFDLGWDSKNRRVTIPVTDGFGQLLNTRLYRLPSMRQDENFPKLLNTDGYGSPAEMFPKARVFSLCSGKHKPPTLFWFTGERDTLLAWDRGIPSFCYTTGENVCKPEWIEEIEELGCSIGVVQDNDKAGIAGAKKRLEMLETAGIKCSLVVLQGEKIKDFSDYIREGGTAKSFLKLVGAKNEKEEPKEEQGEGDGDFYPVPHVIDPTKNPYVGEFHVAQIGRKQELLNMPITCRAIVSGKMDRTYSVPRIIQVGDHQYQIPISREMLQLVREQDAKIMALLHLWMRSKAKVKIISYITITEIEIIPMIQPGVDMPYVNQRCYFFGEFIECNKPYLMRIIPTTDMKTQETIALVLSVEPVSNVLDSYSFSDESIRMLWDEFNIGEEDSFDSLKVLAHSLAINQTHIYNRDDLHLCALLSWMAPLQFEFPCEGIQRGWLNTLILGDTETGKSRICQKLTNLFQCGVFINAESCSYVGLVGGAVKSSSGMFILRWGKIPLYNRQLVVVEELSGLSTQDISHMSEIRSAGVARYDKAGLTGETAAKTRLICLSNVRGEGKSIADYNTGVQAAQGLVGHNEDLARFDLTLTVVDDEVDGSIINKDRSEENGSKFEPHEIKAFTELVMFAWSLKVDQIDFTVGAYRECLIQTMKMCGEYHSSLPVFKAGSGRLKLARIAVSIACIQFSWDYERRKLVVTDAHVKAAASVLHMLFRKPSFGYARYSKIQFNLQKVLQPDELTQKVKECFKDKEKVFYEYISHSLVFTKFDIAEAMNVHFMYVERVLSQLFLSNLTKKEDGRSGSQWKLSTAGRRWIDKKLTEFNTI